LFGAITRVGRCACSISHAVVADLPVPVAPSSTVSGRAGVDAFGQRLDRGRLVARGLVLADDAETPAGGPDVGGRAHGDDGTTRQ
jgi:hypothetical protein